MKVSRDHLMSEKHQKALYKPCTLYSKEPLHGETVFEVEVSLTSVDPASQLMIGLHRVPSKQQIVKSPTPLLPYEHDDYCVWHDGTLWNNFGRVHVTRAYGSIHLTDVMPRSRVGFTISSIGELAFYVDGANQGIATRIVHVDLFQVYAMVTMLEGCHSIRVVKAGELI